MKAHFTVLIFLFLTLGSISEKAYGQQSDAHSAEGKANVLNPIGLLNVDEQSLNFGNIAIGNVTSTITLVAQEETSISVTDGDAKILGTSTQTAAKFQVTGEVGRSYNISLPLSMNVSNGTDNLLMDQFTSSVLNNSGVINSSTIFYVGARLHIPTNKSLGVYSGSFHVEVSYE